MKNHTNKLPKYLIIILLIIIFSLASFIAGILIGEKLQKKEILKKDVTIDMLKSKVNVLDEELQKNNSEVIDYEANIKKEIKPEKKVVPPTIEVNKTTKPKEITKNSTKPKLVIIIDDMAFDYEVKALKKLPYKITPSFFPPSNRHPNTPQLAKEFSHYMVHMPMEAMHYPHPEPETMNITSPYSFIKKRVDMVKNLFPKAKFINNHTGSKFTANQTAMEKLFKALKKDNLGFVDSKTTPYSKASAIDKKIEIPMFARNVFLDNKQNEKYIQNQLKEAIKLAKKYGYAIAIGHPHKTTLKALKDSKKLLSQVEVVYIDELNKN